MCTPHYRSQPRGHSEQKMYYPGVGCNLLVDNAGALAPPVCEDHHAHRNKATLFVSPTFKDVLTEVKHALLDGISLLSHLHVLINLKRDKCTNGVKGGVLSYLLTQSFAVALLLTVTFHFAAFMRAALTMTATENAA